MIEMRASAPQMVARGHIVSCCLSLSLVA